MGWIVTGGEGESSDAGMEIRRVVGIRGREWGGQRGKRWKKWGFITFGGVPRSHAVLGSLQLAAERAVSCLSRRIPYDSIGVREESAMTRFEIE